MLHKRIPKNTQYDIVLFYFLQHKKEKESMVVYKFKVSKNCKDFPLKKKRGEMLKKKGLSVHFIKFGKLKLLKLLP